MPDPRKTEPKRRLSPLILSQFLLSVGVAAISIYVMLPAVSVAGILWLATLLAVTTVAGIVWFRFFLKKRLLRGGHK